MEPGLRNDRASPDTQPHRHIGQIAVAVGVLIFGVALAFGTAQLPEATGYAKVGPRLMPAIVCGGLILLGLVLLKEALFGGFRGVDETDASANPTDWRAFASGLDAQIETDRLVFALREADHAPLDLEVLARKRDWQSRLHHRLTHQAGPGHAEQQGAKNPTSIGLPEQDGGCGK